MRLRFGRDTRHGQASGFQYKVALALGISQIRDRGRDDTQIPLSALTSLDRINRLGQVRLPRLG